VQQNIWLSFNDWLRKAIGSMNKGAGGCYRMYHLPQFYSGGLGWALLLLANSFSSPIIMILFQKLKNFSSLTLGRIDRIKKFSAIMHI
jgi:hypothetical protein